MADLNFNYFMALLINSNRLNVRLKTHTLLPLKEKPKIILKNNKINIRRKKEES